MLRRKRFVILFSVISLILAVNMSVLPVYAREPNMPHLIQTVTEQDIFEGMLSLGFLEIQPLEEADCDKAYADVKNSIVRIDMGNNYGSGIIWKITTEDIIIVTNKHVLDYWDEQISNVCFPMGYYANAEILGISDEHDVGFLTVENKELDYILLERLKYAHVDMEIYENMSEGDEIFSVGANSRNEDGIYDVDESMIYCLGSVGNMWQYIDEFGEHMIYGYGYGVPGMSGGGTFDAKGNLIGMISGGTYDGEIASIPLTTIIEVFEELAWEE
ncbi:MAG: serine protease [Clostridiales bacterium]|nr:serine protease [Clostridiales bacterium]